MTAINVWLTIAGLTLATFVARTAFLLLNDRVSLPPRIERALRYAPACALAAVIVPDLVYTQHALDIGFHNFRLLAAIVATGVFLITRSMLWTIVCGMAAFTALRLVF